MKSVQVLLTLFQIGYLSSVTAAQDPLRLFDPVELTGADLYELLGEDPVSIMGFRFEPDSIEQWSQIPIQIDEKHYQEWQKVRPGDCRLIGRKHSELMYADAQTFSGLDEDPTFDFDDELVLMAKDLGPIKPMANVALPQKVRKVGTFKITLLSTDAL